MDLARVYNAGYRDAPRDPSTVLGFQVASREAVDCAKQSFAALQVFLARNPPELRRIVELGEAKGFVPRFYLWTNDYSRAASPFPAGVREAVIAAIRRTLESDRSS